MMLIPIILLGLLAVLVTRYLISRFKTSGSAQASGSGASAGGYNRYVITGFILLAVLIILFFGFRFPSVWWAPLLGGLAPIGMQLISALVSRFRAGDFGGAQGGARTSEVRSTWLRMTLDHATGHMDGEILLGEHLGKHLSELDWSQLLVLRQSMKDSADSLRLLDAWLDRHHAGWRDQADGADAVDEDEPHSDGVAGGHMTRDEALRILGLNEGASHKEVRAAYRQLMQRLHPDLGGSDYLAAVVNRAKAVLLGE